MKGSFVRTVFYHVCFYASCSWVLLIFSVRAYLSYLLCVRIQINMLDDSHAELLETHIAKRDMLAFVCDEPEDNQL